MDGFVFDDLLEHRDRRVPVDAQEAEIADAQHGLQEAGEFGLRLGPFRVADEAFRAEIPPPRYGPNVSRAAIGFSR